MKKLGVSLLVGLTFAMLLFGCGKEKAEEETLSLIHIYPLYIGMVIFCNIRIEKLGHASHQFHIHSSEDRKSVV